ncbi:LOW QUALITY PROTEIN: RING finger protein 32 [Cyanocitta cristata]
MGLKGKTVPRDSGIQEVCSFSGGKNQKGTIPRGFPMGSDWDQARRGSIPPSEEKGATPPTATLPSEPVRGCGAGAGCPSKQGTRAVPALQDHTIHSHQLQDLLLTDSSKSRTRNTKNFYKSHIKEIVRITVDTGLRKKSTSKEDAEKEYLLDPSSPQLTLAQKSGVVEHPSLTLPAEERVKRKQIHTQHGESIQPCAIFREEFAIQAMSCLKTFEKFTGKNCPMCRKKQYQTRLIHDGACLVKMNELRIQASWRGYIVRKDYRDLREAVPPKDRKLRKQLFDKKLCYIYFLGLFPWCDSAFLNQNS